MLSLIKELAHFEKEPDAVEVTQDDLEKDGFGKTPLFHCFVAEVNSKIEGIALVYKRYSTWKGKALHLEDLIVSEAARGLGLGSALLDEVVKYGHNLGVKRINWEVLNWNEPAIVFYEKKGAAIKVITNNKKITPTIFNILFFINLTYFFNVLFSNQFTKL